MPSEPTILSLVGIFHGGHEDSMDPPLGWGVVRPDLLRVR